MTYVQSINDIHTDVDRIPSLFALISDKRSTVLKYLRLLVFGVSLDFLMWLLMATTICLFFDAHLKF